MKDLIQDVASGLAITAFVIAIYLWAGALA